VTKPDGEIRLRTRAVHVSAGVGGAATRLDAPDRLGASPLPALARLDVVPPRFVGSREGPDLVCRDSPLIEPIAGRVETQRLTTPGGAQEW
jgi:hypothetical protein